ncbi:hypothetical protein LIER_37038 [Lithospermum erythrorhizon]|uniref:Uncharacterized protein n=1 Tax=Lithospermum erythrorhizon TaxID=34254 RepID=A0AAV3PIH1_LITER
MPSFDTNASPVSTLPPSVSSLQTQVHHTRNFTTTVIVALILQGDNQRTTNQASTSHANPFNPNNPQPLWFWRWKRTLRRIPAEPEDSSDSSRGQLAQHRSPSF